MTQDTQTEICYQDETEIHFPTTVMHRQCEGVSELNQRLYQLIIKLQDKYADTDGNAVNSGKISTQGGYQTSTSMNLFTVEDEAISAFKECGQRCLLCPPTR